MSDEKNFLVNPETGNKFLIGGCKISDEPSDLPKFGAMPRMFTNLPPKVDLRQLMTPVEQQEQMNSCVGNALAGAYEFLIMKNKRLHIDVSRLFIYYNGRLIDNHYQTYPMKDEGTYIRSAIEGLKRYGCCKESSFPYHSAYVLRQPSKDCYSEASHYRIADSMSVDCNLDEMKACLAEGYPFAFGLQLFQSIVYAERNGGRVFNPSANESQAAQHGWHAMLAVGYSDLSKCFIVRNSWGSQWGDKGYCYISYEYMANRNYCKDLHAIKTVTEYSRSNPNQTIVHNPYEWTTHNQINNFIPPNYTDQYFHPEFFWKINDTIDYYTHLSNYGKNILNPWQIAQQSLSKEDNKEKNSNGLILWIDQRSDSNLYVVNQLKDEKHIQWEFCETIKDAEEYFIKNKDQIRFSPSFKIISRGYYANEKKNPLDLLQFLLQQRFPDTKIFVFTQDKNGVEHHLEKQAPSFNIPNWRDKLTIIENSNDLIQQIKQQT